MGLLDSLRAKYDIYRLEQRYTKRDKRTTFTSGAHYVNGEYVYNVSSPTSTKSGNSFGSAGAGSRISTMKVGQVFGGKRGSRAF
ncbi:hypothetical protein LTR53_007478 [Teratosphaeriaceae sp. CCFEE 6253]|nr:hypothetical protein LTR53_007478 [Teratosphaeriaceae sp. CCFEE 6253]